MDQWVRLVAAEHGVDVSVVRVSSVTVESETNGRRRNRPGVRGFPVCPEPEPGRAFEGQPDHPTVARPGVLDGMSSSSSFPWELRLRRLECYRFPDSAVRVFDAIDASATFAVEVAGPDGTLKCTFPDGIVVHVSEQQVRGPRTFADNRR